MSWPFKCNELNQVPLDQKRPLSPGCPRQEPQPVLNFAKNSYAQAGVVIPNSQTIASFYPPIPPQNQKVEAQDFFPGTIDEERVPQYVVQRKKPRVGKNSRLPLWGSSRSPDEDIGEVDTESGGAFQTAGQKLAKDAGRNPTVTMRRESPSSFRRPEATAEPAGLGPARMQTRGVRSNFVSPVRSVGQSSGGMLARHAGGSKDSEIDEATQKCLEMLMDEDGNLPDSLRNIEPRLIQHICNEIMTRDTEVSWNDIAGLEHAKSCVTEMVIWPLKRPDLFKGTRAPGSGLLLYGPPGTGKTLIGKAIAGESKATFFAISASSLTSKWIGEGEKLVRALFGVARRLQPAVIFIDEIDSLLSMRKTDGEHESSRRLKTQFLVEMEGCGGSSPQVLVIGATNRPQELDEAVRRRLSKRLYIPLPESKGRKEIVQNLLSKDGLMTLSESDLEEVATRTNGYSGSDMANLVREASMAPLRELMKRGIMDDAKPEDVRPIMLKDFLAAILLVRPSVAHEELAAYEAWSKKFGSGDLC